MPPEISAAPTPDPIRTTTTFPRPAARAEPQLGLAHGLGAVLEPQRQVGVRPQQPLKRDRVPAVGLAVHEYFGALLDEPRHPDSDPEDRGGVHPAVGEYRVQPGHDALHDDVHLMLGGVERVHRLRPRASSPGRTAPP